MKGISIQKHKDITSGVCEEFFVGVMVYVEDMIFHPADGTKRESVKPYYFYSVSVLFLHI